MACTKCLFGRFGPQFSHIMNTKLRKNNLVANIAEFGDLTTQISNNEAPVLQQSPSYSTVTILAP